MKKEAELKYPNSANLFKFCRKVLDYKYGGIRVIDQDVGQILGFDPADCSHWKKGKKNIRSIQAMKNIAGHLGVDEKLVVDIASGEMNDIEAYFEFTGYGSLKLDGKILELAKKEYHRNNINNWSKEKENHFREFFHFNESNILNKVEEIHQTIDFNEAPLYLPEIVAHYPDIVLQAKDTWDVELSSTPILQFRENNKFVINFKSGLELKPFMRFRIAKALASYFLSTRDSSSEGLSEYTNHIQDIESNIFASNLLAPKRLIQKELREINVGKDLIVQLADSFWVSKAFINQRLKELLENPI